MLKMQNYILIAFIAVAALAVESQATVCSIYDIQYTTDPSGDSPYNGQTIDCTGGVVMANFAGGKTKLALYDDNYASGWGGVFAITFGSEFANVQPGDSVSFTNMLVEEYRGNTQLVWTDNTVMTHTPGGARPGPLVVNPADIAIPTDHSSEKYEAMYLQVQNVTVTARDLGKAGDNYALFGDNATCWATDYYISGDLGGETYHPLVKVGNTLDSISGIYEQYTKLPDWDYYQICTTSCSDVVPEPATVSLLLLGASVLLGRKSRKYKI